MNENKANNFVAIACYLNTNRIKTRQYNRKIPDINGKTNEMQRLINKCAKMLMKKHTLITPEKLCRIFVLNSGISSSDFKEVNNNNIYELVYNKDKLIKHLLLSYGENFIPIYLESVENVLKYIFINNNVVKIIIKFIPAYDTYSYPAIDKNIYYLIAKERERIIKLKHKDFVSFYKNESEYQ
eukprot:200548_1